MNNLTYTLKVSSQGQLTLPKELRERLRLLAGDRVTATVTGEGQLRLSDKLPIERHFGELAHLWTRDDQDAADYARQLRDAMQPKMDPTK